MLESTGSRVASAALLPKLLFPTMHKNFPTVAGVNTSFLCSFTDADASELELTGYIIENGQRHPMTLRGNNELIAPATDAGDHLFEIRASGAVVVWGHLMARASAFPPQEGAETAISVTAELRDGVVMSLTITLHEGPRGAKGDKGDPGEGGSITLDDAPTAGSTNAVKSGGVHDADLHVSLGTGSVAMGKNATAQNAYSLALGEGAIAGGYYNINSPTATLTIVSTDRTTANSWKIPAFSVAVGYHAAAASFQSSAFGAYAKAGTAGSTASGYLATASGYYATVSGSHATASGYSATASGYSATASGYQATASGYQATASGSFATASGSFATASGYSAIASGYSATASGYSAIASGYYSIAQGSHSSVFGAVGFTADDGTVVLAASNLMKGPEEEHLVFPNPWSGGWDGLEEGKKMTQLYLIAAGTPLADTYCDSEAGLGFIEWTASASGGSITRRGTRKLSDLLTDHTDDFTPTLKIDFNC